MSRVPKVGDLVKIHKPSATRLNGLIGRVYKVVPCRDGIVEGHNVRGLVSITVTRPNGISSGYGVGKISAAVYDFRLEYLDHGFKAWAKEHP